MKCQDTLFEGNSRVVRGVFLTLVGMLLKVFFLKIITLEPGKKAKWNKKYIKVLERKSVPTYMYFFIRMQQNEKSNDYLTPYISELALALNLQQIVGRIAN